MGQGRATHTRSVLAAEMKNGSASNAGRGWSQNQERNPPFPTIRLICDECRKKALWTSQDLTDTFRVFVVRIRKIY